MARLLPPLLCLALALAAGCKGAQPPAPPASTAVVSAGASPRLAAAFVIAGVVRAPAGILANNGGRVIGNNGANLIGKIRVYRTLAAEQAPLAGAAVYAADAQGQPLAGVAPVLTDALGRYELTGKLAERAFTIVAQARLADGRELALRTLVRATAATADVDAYTTLVTLAALDGAPAQLGEHDPAAFEAAVTQAAAAVDVLPDLADPAAAIAGVRALEARVAALEQALGALRAQAAASPAPAASPTPPPAGTPPPFALPPTPTPPASVAPRPSGTFALPPASPTPSPQPRPSGTFALPPTSSPAPTGAPSADTSASPTATDAPTAEPSADASSDP